MTTPPPDYALVTWFPGLKIFEIWNEPVSL